MYKYKMYFNISIEDVGEILVSWYRYIDNNKGNKELFTVISKATTKSILLKIESEKVENIWNQNYNSDYTLKKELYTLLVIIAHKHLTPEEIKLIFKKFDVSPKLMGQDKR